MIRVYTEKGQALLEGSRDKSLLELLQAKEIYIPAVCGGHGTCGKCKVSMFQNGEMQDVLACKVFISGDADVYACYNESEANEFEILADHNAHTAPCMSIYRLEYDLINKSVSSAIPAELSVPLPVVRKLPFIIAGKKDAYLLVDSDKVFDIFVEDGADAYGIAIDVGTTTIVFELIELLNGVETERRSYSMMNSQRIYGADVISRISYAAKGGLDELTRCITADIANGILELASRAGINPKSIYKIFIAGNTTMTHLLLGVHCEALGSYPFIPPMTGCGRYIFSDIFGSGIVNECAEVVVLPCIAAYVGSDITAGLLYVENYSEQVIGNEQTDKLSLLIDLGTNGEMALFGRGNVLCASAAAGPAFEGGNISCGTGSIPGAISKARFGDGAFSCETIGGKEPLGICGSGLLDIASELLKNGLMDETGLLDEAFTENRVRIIGDIFITQKDIRELQLAKAAVRAGIEILLGTAGAGYDDVQTVFISGGFGHNLNTGSAVSLSIIPREFKDKIVSIGNSSIGGCVKCMTSAEALRRVVSISDMAQDVSLSAHSDFNRLFVEYMSFDE